MDSGAIACTDGRLHHTYFMRSTYTFFMRLHAFHAQSTQGMSFFYCLQHNVFAVSEVVIHAFSRPRNGRTDQQTGGQSTGQTRLLNPAVRMRTVE